MISLYRPTEGGMLDFRSIVERGGRLVSRLTSYREGGAATAGPEEDLGCAASPPGDRAACALLRRALAEGYRVLYAFVLPDASPRMHAFLSREACVEVAPDPADGVPIWPPGRRARGAKPSYLLFTILSSAAK